ncbi:MAG: FIST N-terminal domain-containing protein [Elusimicrobiota bacterium]
MRIGIGLSRDKDCARAAAAAIDEALKAVPEPDLALVYASYHRDHEKVMEAIRAKVDPDVLLGGSSYAEITTAGVTKGSIAALLLSFDGAAVRVADVAAEPVPYETGKALAAKFLDWRPRAGSFPLGLMSTNFATGRENDLLKALRERLEKAPVFGGMSCGDYEAGSMHPDFWKSYQYCRDGLREKSARLALLELPAEDYRAGFGFAHGWQPVGPVVELTRCEHNKVYAVGGVPVIDYYRQFISREESEEFFERDFQRYAFSMLLDQNSAVRSVMKVPVAVDFEKGCITYFPAEDMQGRKVQMILSSRRSAIKGARAAAVHAKESLDGMAPALVLIVSCCTRNAILHSRMAKEVDAVREVFGRDVPVFGFYSAGEIVPFLSRYEDVVDPKQEFSGSHSHATTIGVLALGAKNPALAGVPDAGENAEKDAAYLRGLLEKSEEILDNTESFMANLSRKSYQDSEQIQKQNEIIHRYTPHDVWKQIGDNVSRGDYELHDDEFNGCFLFMDVKGFTSYSEEHGSNEVVCALNEIFKPATEAIYECGGDVDKYIGDCIFAAFRDLDAGVEAGLRIQRLFAVLKEQGNPFTVRVGINAGRAVRANVGGTERREYTFIGDAVNTAQRLESNCTPGKLLIAEELYLRGKERFSAAERREIMVKGKKKPVAAYEVSA